MGKNIFNQIGKSTKASGKWIGHAAEDTFNWTTKTAGNTAKFGLDWTGDQVSKITDIFTSPTFLIVAGVVIVGIIILK